MKKLLYLSALYLMIASCKNATGKVDVKAEQSAKDTANYTTIAWKDAAQNVGTVNFGDKTKILFHFTNTGDKPLFVVSAVPGCGCTVAEFSKGAIAPGKEGEVVAEFDTNKGSPGHFNKSVTVTTNTKGSTSHVLSFEGDIVKAAGGTK